MGGQDRSKLFLHTSCAVNVTQFDKYVCKLFMFGRITFYCQFNLMEDLTKPSYQLQDQFRNLRNGLCDLVCTEDNETEVITPLKENHQKLHLSIS